MSDFKTDSVPEDQDVSNVQLPRQKGKPSKLGDRMKLYEEETTSANLDPTLPFVARIDGHKFSTFLRPFKKPDERINAAMVATTADLVTQFHASLGYTCSDEITLIFPIYDEKESDGKSEKPPKELPFKGRVHKLTTLMASYASVSFYQHLLQEKLEDGLEVHVKRKIPHFDARVFNVPANYELVNNILWRHRFDYRRNSIAGLAFRHFSTKVLHKMNGKQMKEKLLNEKGVDWEAMPAWYKYGVFVKKELYDKESQTPDGIATVARRTRITSHSIELQPAYSKEIENFVISRYFTELPKFTDLPDKAKKHHETEAYLPSKISSENVKVTRIYSDLEGNSKFEDILVPLVHKTPVGTLSDPVPVKNVLFRYTGPDYDDVHTAPKKQLIFLLDGEVQITVTDGTTRFFKTGDILQVEDTTGKGHWSKTVKNKPRKSVFVELAD